MYKFSVDLSTFSTSLGEPVNIRFVGTCSVLSSLGWLTSATGNTSELRRGSHGVTPGTPAIKNPRAALRAATSSQNAWYHHYRRALEPLRQYRAHAPFPNQAHKRRLPQSRESPGPCCRQAALELKRGHGRQVRAKVLMNGAPTSARPWRNPRMMEGSRPTTPNL